VERNFELVGTGINTAILKYSNYIGTVQLPPYVWHVFEIQ
jgi:hypothetical protein